VTSKVAYIYVKVYITNLVRVVNVDLCQLTTRIYERIMPIFWLFKPAIRPDWFDKSRRQLRLLFRVKSSSIFMSNRWSGGADL